jgi:acetyl-CoA C-acetyltransferase
VFGGGNVAALYALMARAHMNRYGTTRRELSQVAVKNHRHASGNEYAQYTNEVSAEVVESTPYVAEPLRAFDCSPASDGAAAVVVVPAEDATAYVDDPVYVEATEQASDSLTVHDRRDITALDATSEAAERAYAEANFSPGDIDFAEVHDSYTIGEVLAVEDLGFAEKGEGGGFIDEGRASVGGETPVNPSGGLKACGHPLGATGVRQVVDATRQLRGDAGTQVEDGSVAVTQNVGGTGGTAVVNVLSDGGSV